MSFSRGQLPFYLVELDEGWAVVTSDVRLLDVVAYADEGVLSLQDLEGTEVGFWFRMKNEQYNAAIVAKTPDSASRTDKYGKDSSTRVMNQYFWCAMETSRTIVSQTDSIKNHLLQTKWGQESPWNYACPLAQGSGIRTVAGCVPVALGQTLYYLHHHLGKPSGLFHSVGYTNPYYTNTFYRYDYVDPSPRWNTMPLNSTMTGTTEVGDLLVDIGRRVGTQYGVYYSSTGGANFLTSSVLSPYEITCQVEDYNVSLIRSDLNGNLPVIIAAFDTNYGSGHCWIIDGYKFTHKVVDISYLWTLVYCPGPEPPGPQYDIVYSLTQMQSIDPTMYDGKTTVVRTEYDNDYWRMNWGYDGVYDNGYYGTASQGRPI